MTFERILSKFNKKAVRSFSRDKQGKKYLGTINLSINIVPGCNDINDITPKKPWLMNYCGKTLTKQQEKSLFEAMHFMKWRLHTSTKRQGNDVNKEKMIFLAIRNCAVVMNIPLIARCQEMSHFQFDRDEMRIYGFETLLNAVDTFDPWRGFKFSTYACNAILRSFRYGSSIVNNKGRKFQQIKDEMLSEDYDDIGMVEYNIDKDTQLTSIINAVHDENILTEKERFVIIQRYNLCASQQDEQPTLDTVGDQMKTCKERVRQIQSNALQKLQKHLLLKNVAI